MLNYICLKSFETLIQGQNYTSDEILAIYDETTVISLINAGIITEITDAGSKKPKSEPTQDQSTI